MVTIPDQIEKYLKAYLEVISDIIPIEKAILFGSYAKGTFTKESDIDLAIFSNYFDNKERIDNFRLLFLEAMNFPIDLQPQPFTNEELHNPEGLVAEIIKTGIEIKLNH